VALYTFGGNPAAVLTDSAGNVVPNYPVLVRVAGTGALVTALYEADGTTPISELRTNPTGSNAPGAIRVFKAADVTAIEYEYNGPNGPVRWYEAGREVAQQALDQVGDKLSTATGGTVTAPVTLAGGATVESGLDVSGGATVDSLHATGDLTVNGIFDALGGISLSGMRIFNPRIYGAAGNGTANDAPAIQAALSAASAAGGGWVIVPPGTYRLATLPLRIYRNTRLTLMPGAKFVRAADATLLLNGDADQTFGGYTGHGNLTIEGGVWDMRSTTPGLTGSRMCISLGHAENITIRGVEIRDTPGFHAVEVNACRDVHIVDCRFLGFTDPGGRDLSEAVQIDLALNSGAFGGFGPYDLTPCRDIEMTGCYVGPSGTPGTTSWPRGVGSHAASLGVWHRRIRIAGNNFESCPQYAVSAYNWDEVAVTDNTIDSCGAGVWLRVADAARGGFTQDAQVATVAGNVIRNSTGYDDPIILQGESGSRIRRVAVTGNTIDGSAAGQNGVRLQFCEEFAVTGNLVHGCTGSGISLFDANDGSVTGNRVDNSTVHGISLDTSTNVLVGGNHVSVCGTNGLYVLRGGAVRLADNFVRACGRTDGTGFGIRVSTNVAGVTITNNTYRKAGDGGNEAVNAIGITSSVTGVRRFGNDVLNQGNPTAIADGTTGANLSPYDAGTP